MGLTTAYGAVALYRRASHLDAQRTSLIQQFHSNWPDICGRDMKEKYAPILDPTQHRELLNAQLLEMQQRLKGEKGATTQGQLFDQFLQLHSLSTLGNVLIQNTILCQEGPTCPRWVNRESPLEDQAPTMRPFCTYKVETLKEQLWNRFLYWPTLLKERPRALIRSMTPSPQSATAPRLLEPAHPTENAQAPLLQWSDWIETLFKEPDEEKAILSLGILLNDHETTLFQYLSADTREQLFSLIRKWMTPVSEETPSFPEDRVYLVEDSFSSSKLLFFSRLKTLGRSCSSPYFNWESDIYAPVLAQKLPLEGIRVFEKAQSLVEPAAKYRFATAFSQLYPDDNVQKAWAQTIRTKSLNTSLKNDLVLIHAFVSISELWKETLMPCIKRELIESQQILNVRDDDDHTERSTRAFQAVTLFAGYLSAPDAETLRQLSLIDPRDPSYAKRKEVFLCPTETHIRVSASP